MRAFVDKLILAYQTCKELVKFIIRINSINIMVGHDAKLIKKYLNVKDNQEKHPKKFSHSTQLQVFRATTNYTVV